MKSSDGLFHPSSFGSHPFYTAGAGARFLADNRCSFVVRAENAAAQRWDGPGTRVLELINAREETPLSLSASSFALFQALARPGPNV